MRRRSLLLSAVAAGFIGGLLVVALYAALVLIVPLDVLVRRKKDCYCFTGGFAALLLGVMALCWLLGP